MRHRASCRERVDGPPRQPVAGTRRFVPKQSLEDGEDGECSCEQTPLGWFSGWRVSLRFRLAAAASACDLETMMSIVGRLARLSGVVIALSLVAVACGGSIGSEDRAPAATREWWTSEPELAPHEFAVLATEDVASSGGEVSGAGVEISVPNGALDETATVSVREALGPFGHEIGGPIVGINHRRDLALPVTVRWDVSGLNADQRASLLVVRWHAGERRWVPDDVEATVEGDVAEVELLQWSFWSWIANTGQVGQELVGRRAAAPRCVNSQLHDWVAGVVDPDEDAAAAAMRVCFENDRDKIVTMRVVNNRTFSQFVDVDGSDGWEWVWTGEDELSAVQAVRAGAAAVFNDDDRVFVPPLHEIAVGIDRPRGAGSHFIEFRNRSNVETILTDVVMLAMSKLEVPGPGVEQVGVLVEATLECAVAELLTIGSEVKLDEVARAITNAVTSCGGKINDPNSDVGLAFRTKLSQRIAKFESVDDAADAMAQDRLLRSASRVLRALVVVEVITYLGDIAAEELVGDLRWSLRGSGRSAALGEWKPSCGDLSTDSNRLYRNLALQDEFADASIELHDFPQWPRAARTGVRPLVACDAEYLVELAKEVRLGWGDAEAARIVADELARVARAGNRIVINGVMFGPYRVAATPDDPNSEIADVLVAVLGPPTGDTGWEASCDSSEPSRIVRWEDLEVEIVEGGGSAGSYQYIGYWRLEGPPPAEIEVDSPVSLGDRYDVATQRGGIWNAFYGYLEFADAGIYASVDYDFATEFPPPEAQVNALAAGEFLC